MLMRKRFILMKNGWLGEGIRHRISGNLCLLGVKSEFESHVSSIDHFSQL
jgi:hypothetical protein